MGCHNRYRVILLFTLDALWSGCGLHRCAFGLGHFDVEQPPELHPRSSVNMASDEPMPDVSEDVERQVPLSHRLLRGVKDAQAQHGLRHNDWARYR